MKDTLAWGKRAIHRITQSAEDRADESVLVDQVRYGLSELDPCSAVTMVIRDTIECVGMIEINVETVKSGVGR